MQMILLQTVICNLVTTVTMVAALCTYPPFFLRRRRRRRRGCHARRTHLFFWFLGRFYTWGGDLNESRGPPIFRTYTREMYARMRFLGEMLPSNKR